MLGMCIFFLSIEYMFGEDELDEFQATRDELFEDIYDKNTIIQTILKESEKKEISHEEINEIINPNFALL
jgi:hypothetical protein